MSETPMQLAARTIAERTVALNWLKRYGVDLTGRCPDAAGAKVWLNYGSAMPGAKEAEALLTAYARFELPSIVQSAIRCCENDIRMAQETIREELNGDSAALST